MSSNAHPKPAGALSIGELELGLRLLERSGTDQAAFWHRNNARFRRTVLLAIRDTAEALLSPDVSPRWRSELEGQLLALAKVIGLPDEDIPDEFLTRVPRTVN